MTGIRRVSQLGTTGESTYVDGSIQAVDIAANAITQAKLSTDIPLSGFRNVIINGGFDVWQRSTSATTTGADSYASADRWRIRTANGGGSILSSRQSASLAGFQYCMRFQRVSGNTDTGVLQLIQTLETPMSVPLAGRDVTVSFWARKGANYSPTSSAFKVYLQSGTSTDAYWLSFTGSANLITQTTTLTSTWQKFSFTAAAGSTATQFYLQFEMTPTGTAGANDYFEITGVQLEAGTQATPFEQRPFGAELSLCQRYFWKLISAGISYLSFQYAGTQYRLTIPNPVQMRAAPHTVTSSTWQGGSAAPTVSAASVLGVNWVTTAGWFYLDNSSSMEISAEL